jgi:hypothetical protein
MKNKQKNRRIFLITISILFLTLPIEAIASIDYIHYERDSIVEKKLSGGVVSIERYKKGILRSEIHLFENKRILVKKVDRLGNVRKYKIMFPAYKMSGN